MSSVPQGGDPETIELRDFAAAVNSGDCVVVDVREPHEFAAGHIPEAISLPLSTFDPAALPPVQEKPVILICQAGARSRTAVRQARASGRPDVRHYAGGMNGWRMAGGDVEL